MFTRLLSTVALVCLTFVGFTSSAQTVLASAESAKKVAIKKDSAATEVMIAKKAEVKKAAEDTAWKPQRRIWGYAFGDFAYTGHAPAVNSTFGKENNYYQVPTYRNSFQFRRIYLGYDYEITKKFKAEVLLEAAPSENTALATTAATTGTVVIGGVTYPVTIPSTTSGVANGDNTADGKIAFYIKNFNLRTRDLWTGTDFVIGEMSTPGFALNEPGTNGPTSLSEATWGYRSIEKTVTDFHSNNSFDVGAALQGTFDPDTKNFGYVLMVGNNTKATNVTIYNSASGISATNPNPNTGFFKIFYGDIWTKWFNNHLYVDVYADYAKTASNTVSTATAAGFVGPQEHNMEKIFAAYVDKKFTFGVEAYTQKIGNAVVNTTNKVAEDATVNAFSVFAKGTFAKNWNAFGRFDKYNPDTKFNGADTYGSALTNYSAYDPTVKSQFYTFGLDYNPTKNVHFMPNVWFIRYFDQYDTATKGYLPDNHTLVYRFTFFYTFGK